LAHFDSDGYQYSTTVVNGIGSGRIPTWWWDPGIHLSDRLHQMTMKINKVVTVIGLLYFWDVSRGEVETYSIWQDRLSFLKPRIEAGNGFADLDFTETPLQGVIQDSGFSPFRDFSLGFQERRMQTWHIGPTVMIGVVQRQHGGSFLGLVWDPGITLFDSSTTVRDERAGFDFQEFTLGISWVDSLAAGINGRANRYFQELIHMEHWIGVLGGIFYEGWTEYLQYLFSLLISGLQEASCVSTLQDNIVAGRCFHVFQIGLGPWYHFQFQSGSVNGASGCDGIA
jgi:hypothetical protein